MDFLKELQDIFGENLAVAATWLNPLPEKAGQPQQYSLTLSVELSQADMKILTELLQKRRLDIKNEKDFWVIFSNA
ncbi:MAG: hypothetical protein NWE93_05355 [Candidatus Bathyarchaeota archaeon]|nr:hypothetical protein [Candidatus Bathyarchaeota archaeon]